MKDYLNVGEMSKLFNLNKQTLQYYDKVKIFSPEYRDSSNNYRLYSFSQVYGLALICYLRKIGFSIAQIKQYLEIHDRDLAITQLKGQSKVLKERYSHLLSMDSVLQRKIKYIETKMKSLELGKVEIKHFDKRKYILLGEEPDLYNNEIFYFYPTICLLTYELPSLSTGISFGAYLEPGTLLDEKYIDNVRTIEPQDFLCTCFKGSYTNVISYCHSLRDQYARNDLEPISYHFNIIDQFIENDKNEYITEIQIPIKQAKLY